MTTACRRYITLFLYFKYYACWLLFRRDGYVGVRFGQNSLETRLWRLLHDKNAEAYQIEFNVMNVSTGALCQRKCEWVEQPPLIAPSTKSHYERCLYQTLRKEKHFGTCSARKRSRCPTRFTAPYIPSSRTGTWERHFASFSTNTYQPQLAC